MAAMPAAVAAVSHIPCCWSMLTAEKPPRAITSATIGAGKAHQPEKTVSPARRRGASVKPGAAIAELSTCLDLRDGLGHQLVHRGADFLIACGHLFGVEVLANLAENVVVAGLFEVRHDDFFRVGIHVQAGQAQFTCSPLAQKLIPARR